MKFPAILLAVILPIRVSAQLCSLQPHNALERFQGKIEEEVVTLSPFIVQEKQSKPSEKHTISKETFRAIDDIVTGKREKMLKKLRLTFADVSLVSPDDWPSTMDLDSNIPLGISFRKFHGGIKLGDNATLYFRSGVLWEPLSGGRYKFYFPYHHKSISRSVIGFGVEMEWEDAIRSFFSIFG